MRLVAVAVWLRLCVKLRLGGCGRDMGGGARGHASAPGAQRGEELVMAMVGVAFEAAEYGRMVVRVGECKREGVGSGVGVWLEVECAADEVIELLEGEGGGARVGRGGNRNRGHGISD